eukprot:1701794-Pyramimonas_sp.AAC.1
MCAIGSGAGCGRARGSVDVVLGRCVAGSVAGGPARTPPIPPHGGAARAQGLRPRPWAPRPGALRGPGPGAPSGLRPRVARWRLAVRRRPPSA